MADGLLTKVSFTPLMADGLLTEVSFTASHRRHSLARAKSKGEGETLASPPRPLVQSDLAGLTFL